MARRRKRNWSQRVYKYRIVRAELPQAFWDIARKMNELWCNLSRAHEAVRKTITDATTKQERKAAWQGFDEEARVLVRDSGLNWECGPEVLDRFQASCRRAAKTQKAGWPKPHGMQRICIPHRFTGGGAALASLTSKTAKRIRLSRLVRDRGVVEGAFGLDRGEAVSFAVLMHRPIPAGVIVKKVCWVGERDVFGWHWSLTVTVEIPPGDPRVETGRVCAIDLGWRKRADYLRVGLMVNDAGTVEEFCLPLDMSNSRSRRFNARYGDKQMVESHAGLRALQTEIDGRLEACKARLRELLSPLPAGFDKMRQRGLYKLKHDLEPGAARDVLTAWSAADVSARERYVASFQRVTRRRQWIYRNYAARLCRMYDQIVLEDGLDIAGMIGEGDKSPALQAGDRYHQYAATYDLKLAIIQAASKYGCVVEWRDCIGTTDRCWECGGKVAVGQPLVLVCENGHAWDQDENAARVLLSQLVPVSVQKERLRGNSEQSALQATTASQEFQSVPDDVASGTELLVTPPSPDSGISISVQTMWRLELNFGRIDRRGRADKPRRDP